MLEEGPVRYSWTAAALADITFTAVASLLGYEIYGIDGGAIAFIIVSFVTMALSMRVLNDWDRMAVLRFGRYVGMIGPGLYLIVPFIDSTPITVDMRVISTVLRIEKIGTKDGLQVDADAIISWQVTEPQKAILNVHSYYDAVLFESQNAVKDIISNSVLAEILAGKDVLSEDIKKLIGDRIGGWGIEVISVELKDVLVIPGRTATPTTREALRQAEERSAGALPPPPGETYAGESGRE